MLEGWRGRRVLIVGNGNGLCAFLAAVLEEIGARPTRIDDTADAQTLCRALTLGARALMQGEGGVYHIGTDARSICTNRSAARRLSTRHFGTKPIAETETARADLPILLDGSAARRLCGAACRLDADQALDLLFAERQAAREGREEEAVRQMTRTYLEACRA